MYVFMYVCKEVEVALEIDSDQTVPEKCDLWSEKFDTIVQTEVRSKPFPDYVIRAHREHVCSRKFSDQMPPLHGHLDLGVYVCVKTDAS